MQKTHKELTRILLALALVALMAATRYWGGVREALIPEIAALATGFWIQDKQIWRIGRWQTPLLLVAVALVAILANNYVPNLTARLCIVFAVTALLLVLLKATLSPAFAVGMLPVLLGTTSFVYPLVVLVLATMLVLGQQAMDATGLREHEDLHHPMRTTWRNVLRWGALMLTLLPLMLVAELLNESTQFASLPSASFCIAPPLVVAFVELSNSKGGFRFRLLQTWAMLLLAVFFGVASRLWLSISMGIAEPFSLLVAETLVFLMFRCFGKRFAPAAAMALIPFVVSVDAVSFLPLYIAIGATYVVLVARLFFIKTKNEKM